MRTKYLLSLAAAMAPFLQTAQAADIEQNLFVELCPWFQVGKLCTPIGDYLQYGVDATGKVATGVRFNGPFIDTPLLGTASGKKVTLVDMQFKYDGTMDRTLDMLVLDTEKKYFKLYNEAGQELNAGGYCVTNVATNDRQCWKKKP